VHLSSAASGMTRGSVGQAHGASVDYRYAPGFLAADEAEMLLAILLANADWRQERIRLFGRRVEVPRLVAWYGDPGINYRYSNLDHTCHGWLPELAAVRERLASDWGFTSTLVLLNRYRDGRDGMGWHTDDEPGHGAWLASISLGAARRFSMRADDGRGLVSLVLEPGSLLFMRGAVPHALPKSARPLGERVNLTFRQVSIAEPRSGADPCREGADGHA
jgi:alkylated DNA repair dioxygenase AlkB